MNAEIPIAVVGLGPRALGTWIPSLLRIPGYRVVSVCDRIGPLVDRAVAAIPYPVRTATDYAEVLADPGVEAVALVVRSPEQGAMAAAALEAGKHVHAEVPAAHTIEDCWRIVRAAAASDRVYALAEQTRYWGFVEEWRKLVAAGELGHPTLCEGQYFHHLPGDKLVDPATGEFYGPDNAPPQAVPTWQQRMPPIHYLPHELSPMLKVLDDRVTEVVAMSTRPTSYAHPTLDQPDMQVALMKTEKDTILRMAASFAQPHPHGEWHWYHLSGTGGRLEWRRAAQDQPKLWLSSDPDAGLRDMDWGYERADAPNEAVGSGHGDADYYVHASFRDAVRGVSDPELSVYQAMETAAPAILAAESIKLGGQPQLVPDFRPAGFPTVP
ncbi:Gfo/Idh/MocA family protein [Microlunatus speluncae]|uniref:Gfo/Idh/MocA family protein n=1 Tax=Microlunatus speluncae TaxID=2594267 RepID=UPI0013762678|nr:Gfo/Idh/MocA family oxidoreductase [Microlunatus speluncae]